ncbi:MAG: tetratricopeptide repeat protein [Rikenellaceae bacterium]|nr:tetratricopeptide repeat protein [Rikenellaceae bacterium]
MKRILMMVAAVLLVAAPAANAQKVNADALKAKVAKADADAANAKKNVKSATWLTRGQAYLAAVDAPEASLYIGMPVAMLEVSLGKAISSQEVKKGYGQFIEMAFPYVNVYVDPASGTVASWQVTKPVVENGAAVAVESFKKAKELDAKAVVKANEGLTKLKDHYLQEADNMYKLGEYKAAAAGYAVADELLNDLGTPDQSLAFNIGYCYVLDGNFDAALPFLEKSKANNYEADGTLYYLLFHCYFKSNTGDMVKSKETLLEGVSKYPQNNNLIESMTMFYSREGSTEDPEEVFGLIKSAIDADPTNVELWAGLGNVYLKSERWDEAIETYTKAVELQPENEINQLRLGYTYCLKGDAAQDELTKQTFTSYEESNKAQDAVLQIYAASLPALEKAYALNGTNRTTIELLKSIYYRLSYDDEAMKAKYDEINAVYKQMNEQ